MKQAEPLGLDPQLLNLHTMYFWLLSAIVFNLQLVVSFWSHLETPMRISRQADSRVLFLSGFFWLGFHLLRNFLWT